MRIGEVHLVVGAVHPRGVVDKVSIGATAGKSVLNPRQLGQSEIAPLTHYLAAQFAANDPRAFYFQLGGSF